MPAYIAAEAFMTIEEVRDQTPCPSCIPDDLDDDIVQAWIDQSSDLLAAVSGMRVAGRWSLIARPCRDGMRCGCDCCHLDAIPFGAKPEISEITINGDILDPEEYDLHWTLNGWNLVRIGDGITHPESWPSYQELWKRDDTAGTFTIRFTMGVQVDQQLITDALLELICDFAAGNGNNDSLAPGVVQASLGGATIVVDPDRLARIAAGESGPAMTRLLAVFAPYGRQTSAVYAPELHDGWDLHIRQVAPG